MGTSKVGEKSLDPHTPSHDQAMGRHPRGGEATLNPHWDPYWTHIGSTLGPYWMGTISDPYWTHLGPILSPHWIYMGHILDPPNKNGG